MFCDKCGTAITSGAQFCSSCGKAVGAAPIAAQAPAARPASDGRVQRHIQLLATLWLLNGILRFAEVGSIFIVGRTLPFLPAWAGRPVGLRDVQPAEREPARRQRYQVGYLDAM